MILTQTYTRKKDPKNLGKVLSEVDYILISPGVSIHDPKNKKKLKNIKIRLSQTLI